MIKNPQDFKVLPCNILLYSNTIARQNTTYLFYVYLLAKIGLPTYPNTQKVNHSNTQKH